MLQFHGILISLPKEEIKVATEKPVKHKGLKMKDLIELSASISLVSFFFALVYASIVSFVSVYAKELQLTEIASYFFIVYVIALLISRPFTGKWFRIVGANIIMIPSIISFALGMFLLSQAEGAFTSYCLQPLSVLVGITFKRLRFKWLRRKEKVLPQLLSCQPWIRVLGLDRLSSEL